MSFLSDFADQAVILPIAAAVALLLAATGWWRGLGAWVLAVGGALGTVGILKALCVACAVPLAPIGLHSPSGHTASAAVVFGGLAVLAVAGRGWIAVAAPLSFAVVFGATRLILQVHTVPDVLVGGIVGVAGGALLALLVGPPPPVRRWTLAAPLALVLVFHGWHLPAEAAVRSWASLWLPAPAVCRA